MNRHGSAATAKERIVKQLVKVATLAGMGLLIGLSTPALADVSKCGSEFFAEDSAPGTEGQKGGTKSGCVLVTTWSDVPASVWPGATAAAPAPQRQIRTACVAVTGPARVSCTTHVRRKPD